VLELKMDATEARKLTEIYLHPDIETMIKAIDERIEEAARSGQSHIVNPESGHLRDGAKYQLTQEERRALRQHFESRGFKWQSNPKAEHPCCRGLTTLSW
jgi:hypothetical protein